METVKEKKPKVGESPFCKRFDAFLKQTSAKNSNNLAAELGDSNPVKYRRWLAGEVLPSASSLKPIAAHYGISIDWLVKGDGEMFIQVPQKSPLEFDSASATVEFPEMGELIRLRTESVKDKALIDELRRQLTELRQESKEKDREWRDWAKEGFCESDSHNHRFQALIRESYRVEGLKRYDVLAQGKVVRLHPAVKRFTLNSRQPVEKQAS